MEPTLVMILCIVVASLIIPGLFFLQQYTFSDRQVQMRGLANEMGLEYLTGVPKSQLGSISTSHIMQKSDDGRVINFMFGQTDQARIQVFDYEYVVQNQRCPHTRRQTIVAMMFTGMQLAPCRVSPEGLLNFVAEWLGDQDINFPDHPEFSRMFVVQSHFEDETRQMFDQPLMDFFCQDPELNFESTRTAFLLYRPNQLLTIAQIRGLMKDAYSMYQELLDAEARRPVNPAIQTLKAYSVPGNEPTIS